VAVVDERLHGCGFNVGSIGFAFGVITAGVMEVKAEKERKKGDSGFSVHK
jgi:hypothetical protein